jgi:hypothetical protein
MHYDQSLPNPDFNFSDGQILALRYSSVIASGFSFALGIITLILFLRMKRSFRHELVAPSIDPVFSSLANVPKLDYAFDPGRHI